MLIHLYRYMAASSLFGAPAWPRKTCPRKRKGAGRRSVQQLPRPYRSTGSRIHAEDWKPSCA